MHTRFLTLLTIVTAAWLCLTSTGCVPKAIVWLADSSGIVYTDSKDSGLIVYSLEKRAKRIIVADTGTDTPWPAINAAGTRLAVAKVELSYVEGSRVATTRTEIRIYDMSGQLVDTSKLLVTTERKDEPSSSTRTITQEVGLNWSGPADKILMQTAVYDVDDETWTKFDLMANPFGNQPIRPDGKGFLAFGSGSKGLFFVDWDGWVYDIDMSAAPEDAMQGELYSFGWEGNTALFEATNGLLSIDTDKRAATFERREPAVLDGEGDLKTVHAFPAGGLKLCAFEVKVGGNDRYRLEVQAASERKRRTLLGTDEIDSLGWFFPSPNGKLVAFTVSHPDGDDEIVIVSDEGKIEARVKL